MCLYETDTDVKYNKDTISKNFFMSSSALYEHNAVHFEMYTLP